MSEQEESVCFHNPEIFAGDVGVIDKDACVVHGVSLIKGNLVAEGHGLTVDKQTLTELQACAKSRGKVPVGLDHSAGIASTCGYITGFRVDGDKLRGDLHLLKTHAETPRIMERAETMPTCFGLSVAFKGPPKGVPIPGGGMAARCEKLLSIDLVQRPAANDGLFSIPVDSKDKNNMAKDAQGNEIAEPTLAQVLEAVQGLTGRIDRQDEFLQSLTGPESNESNEPTLEDFANASDEELEAFNQANNTNITRADINAAVAEVMAGEGRGEGRQGEGEGEGEGEPAGAAAGAGAGVDVSTGGADAGAQLSALRREVVELKAHNKSVELKAKNEAEEIELAAIEKKALTLASQRDQAIELAEHYKAENDALRMAVKTGTRPVKAGVDNGVRMFGANGDGELHEFQLRVKQLTEGGKTEAEAIRFAIKENPAMHADWVASQQRKVPA
jgi:hypothetical protein